MRILLTGANGSLAAVLAPRLAANKHQLVLFDSEPVRSSRYAAIQADIRDASAVVAAMQGCDAVVHYQGCELDMASRRNYEDFYSLNTTGTHNVLLAMFRLGVKNLVYLSSDAVYGAGARDKRVIDEDVPLIPNTGFALSKALAEEMCEFYARQHGFHTAVLRCGWFGTGDWKTAGLGLLGNWVDPDDVAQAVELALGAAVAEQFQCQAFLIQSEKPFVDDDWPGLFQNPNAVIEHYWPGAVDLLADHGLAVPALHHRYDLNRARTVLGYASEHNFEQFLARLRRERPA